MSARLRPLLSTAATIAILTAIAAATGCDGPAATPDAGCSPGNAGCACIEGNLCQGGLTCDMGLCRGVVGIELIVDDAAARACEVVVVEEGTEVLGVDFSPGTTGTSIHEAPRTAITFHRDDDTAFAAGAITVRRTDGTAPSLSLRHARCFDRDGNALGGDPLRIGG
jgi:hypothetical protein